MRRHLLCVARGCQYGLALGAPDSCEVTCQLTMVDNADTFRVMHTEAHPDAGQTVNVLISTHPTLPPGVHQFVIEGWWDHLTQSSWMYAQGNPAALIYAVHSGMAQLPIDDEVLYGHIGGAGVLLHVSEINQEVGA